MFLIILLLFFPLTAQGILINEVAWMGTINSANDEWIELYNETNLSINLEGWTIYEEDTLMEPLTGSISPGEYYLIERTDDESVPNIPASQEPSGWGGRGLKNTGEHLKLLDSKSKIIDELNCIDGWFAGDSSTKQTMERNGDTWQTSQDSGGTPKAQNGSPATIPVKEVEPVKTTTINSPSKPSEKVTTEKPSPLIMKDIPKTQKAEIREGIKYIPKDKSSPFLISLFLAIISGVAIILVKRATEKAPD